MSRGTTRRQFLQTTALAGVGYWVAGGVRAADSSSPNETINFACIGVGGKGQSDSADAGKNGNVVAICDIDDNTLRQAATKFPKAKQYNDYRKMLDEMGDQIDAVTISTPDHTHAPAAVRVMKMGKHCFCQKPLTHTIHEARLLGEIAREMKVATQMGNQGTANTSLRRAAAIIQAGTLGPVKEVHVWTNRPVWPQGLERPTEEVPVPPHVHWDEWIGAAEFRPYNPCYHPFKWRGWWEFGTGALGDMACHTLNMPYMALALRDPVSVQAQTSGHNQETYPKWSEITFEFPANDDRPALTLKWYDGGKRPSASLLQDKPMDSSGALVVGEKGSLYAPGDYAEKEIHLLGEITAPDVDFVRSPGHFEEWVQAIKGSEPARSNFPDYASPLTETILLGNLAVWADGKKVQWDAANLSAPNAPEVAHIIKKEYREGYGI
jgi:predicted dehydrogenase